MSDSTPSLDDDLETRVAPSAATKIAFGLAAVLVVFAVYFLLVPVLLPRDAAGPFYCGSAVFGAGDAFADKACGQVTRPNLYWALALLATAVIVAVTGWTAFGPDGDLEDDEDEDDDDLR